MFGSDARNFMPPVRMRLSKEEVTLPMSYQMQKSPQGCWGQWDIIWPWGIEDMFGNVKKKYLKYPVKFHMLQYHLTLLANKHMQSDCSLLAIELGTRNTHQPYTTPDRHGLTFFRGTQIGKVTPGA